MAFVRTSLASRVAAAVLIGGALSLAGVVVASPAGAATTSSTTHASMLTNISSAHPDVKDPCFPEDPKPCP